MKTIQEKINDLGDLSQQLETKIAAKAEAVKKMMPEGYDEKVAALEEEYHKHVAALMPPELTEQISTVLQQHDLEIGKLSAEYHTLENEIKTEVIKIGSTVKGKILQCVFSNGRRSIDVDNFIRFVISIKKRLHTAWLVANKPLSWEEIQPVINSLVTEILDLVETGDPITTVKTVKQS